MTERQKEYNAANNAQVDILDEEAKNLRDQEIEDIKDILSRPSGLRFFKRFMVDGQIFRTTFTNNGWTAFNEGARNLALKYFNEIANAAPNKIAEIMIKREEE